MQNFEGILFTLKKRMQNPSEDDTDRYGYLTFGYYDGLDIKCIHRWFDYRPKGLIDYGLALDIKDEFIDLYTIKALFPKNVSALEEQGFFYMPVLKGEKINYPFVTMSLLNLSEQSVDRYRGYEALNEAVYHYVKAVLEEEGGSGIKCAVFPSIGYSDYIMLCFAEGFSGIATVVDGLRKKKLDNGDTVFSSCYTVCGINMNWESMTEGSEASACECWQSVSRIPKEPEVKLSVKINLKSGKSSNEFISRFISEVRESLDKSGVYDTENIREIEKDWEYYFHTFGNSDNLFIPDSYLDTYLPLYMKGGLFNPASDFFKSYITNIHSTIRVREKSMAEPYQMREHTGDDQKRGRIQSYRMRYARFIPVFEQFIKENELHRRTVKALEQLMKSYLNLAQLLHSFDVEVIIGEIFEAFMQNLYYVMEKYEDDEIDLSGVIVCVNKFSDIMRVYITDMAHSDKLFIEGQTLTHPSVGSATKLLFAYNKMLLELMKRMRESEGADALSEFTMLVTSGGCDRTNVRDLFSVLGNRLECPKILVATIPEISLYDIKGTIFRLFHECMHYCGKRHRRERYCFQLRVMGKFVAHNIATILYDENTFGLYFEQIALYFTKSSRELNRVKADVSSIYEKNKCRLQQKLAECIIEDSYFEENEMEEVDYYLSNLQNTLFHVENIAEVFLSDVNEEGTLGNRMYACIRDNQIRFFQEMSGYAKAHNILYTGFDSFIQHKRYVLKKEAKEAEIICFLREYMELSLQRVHSGKLLKIAEEANVTKYGELYEAVSGALKEGFADCFAIKALQMDCEDFLLSFIYEEWDIEQAMPDLLLNIMRIGADLAVMYDIEKELGAEQREGIVSRAAHWEKQGYTYQNVGRLMERIDSILSNYYVLKTQGLTYEVEAYLNLCVKDVDFPVSSELVDFYRTCGFRGKEEIYAMMEYLTCEWEGLKNGSTESIVR